MPSAADIVNFILEFVGLVSLIPICFKLVKGYLPNSRLKKFDKLVSETEDYIELLEEEGVFSKSGALQNFRSRLRRHVLCASLFSCFAILTALRRMRDEAESRRCSTYCATTTLEQLKGLFNGLSKDISKLCTKALRLRAEISVRGISSEIFLECISVISIIVHRHRRATASREDL